MGLSTKLLAEGEAPLVVLRPHVRRLVRPALLLLVLAPATAYGAAAVPAGAAQPTVRAVVAGVAALVAARWVVWPFVVWWNTLYVLTDERLFERAGVVRRTGHDLPLRGVSDVVVAQRLGERVLRSGTMSVSTDGGTDFTLTDVPGVTRLQRALLAVADDVAERFAARPPRRRPRDEEPPGGHTGDGEEPGGRYLDARRPPATALAAVPTSAVDPGAGLDHDLEDDPGDDPTGVDRADRRDLRRRERESARRLRALQEQVRRGSLPPEPDSPVEDDGAPASPASPSPAGPDGPGKGPVEDDGGARILRFPRRS